jgi:hypothetical protein
MINLGVQLLPENYKAFAWIDADVEFENADWAMDTLKILNGSKDVVQLFSHCVDMDREENQMNVYNSAGYQFCRNGDERFRIQSPGVCLGYYSARLRKAWWLV